jgi:hypothetical protein
MVWAETPFDLKTKEIIVLTTMAAQDLPDELGWHVKVALSLGSDARGDHRDLRLVHALHPGLPRPITPSAPR